MKDVYLVYVCGDEYICEVCGYIVYGVWKWLLGVFVSVDLDDFEKVFVFFVVVGDCMWFEFEDFYFWFCG